MEIQNKNIRMALEMQEIEDKENVDEDRAIELWFEREQLLRNQNAESRFLEDEDFRENILKRMREVSAKELVEMLWSEK